jgi:hypothetical protein
VADEQTTTGNGEGAVSEERGGEELFVETSGEVDEEDAEELDEEEEEELDESAALEHAGPRFDFIEIIFLISLCGAADALELLDLTGVGIVIGLLVDFGVGPATVMYLWLKGTSHLGKNAIAQGIELIPVLDVLPIRTTAIILTILAVNHPKMFEKAGVAGKIAQKALTKGKG